MAVPLHILLVEDDLEIRDVVAEFLQSQSHSVALAASGEEAIAAIQGQKTGSGAGFDVVILDWLMKGTSGRALIAQLQGLCPGVPILITTGYGASEISDEIVGELGLLGLLRKPFSLRDLMLKLRAVPKR